MIPSLLIVGPTIRGAQVERVVGLVVLLPPERDADEAARSLGRARRRSAGNLRLDHAVREGKTLDRREQIETNLNLRAGLGGQAFQPAPSFLGERQAQAFPALERGR